MNQIIVTSGWLTVYTLLGRFLLREIITQTVAKMYHFLTLSCASFLPTFNLYSDFLPRALLCMLQRWNATNAYVVSSRGKGKLKLICGTGVKKVYESVCCQLKRSSWFTISLIYEDNHIQFNCVFGITRVIIKVLNQLGMFTKDKFSIVFCIRLTLQNCFLRLRITHRK